jgi:PAS domain S-box-containing protein
MSKNQKALAGRADGSTFLGTPVSLESILCTDELDRRPSRPPDYETENRALVALAQALADSPKTVLQTLADTILDVLQSDSAGISLLTKDEKRFYWPAIAGVWKPHLGGGTPRDFGPCGDVLDRNMPLMFSHVERRYNYFLPVTPAIEECLLVPFYVQGKAVGTIWAIAHSDRRKFDAEDMRQLVSLGRFTSSAYQVIESLDLMEKHAAALRENEHRFREMFDALPAAIYTTDAEGMLTHFNRACIELSGRTPVRGSDYWCVSWKLYRPDGTPLPHDECPMAIALKEGCAVCHQMIILERPDGTRVLVMPYPTPLRDPQGKIVGGINMLMDITESSEAEIASRRLAAIVESSDDAIVSKTLDGIITSWNRSAERMFGYTAAEAVGQHISLIIPAERRSEEDDVLAHLRRGEKIDHFETERQTKDGRRLSISLTVSPVKDSAGRIIGASKVARDITERKQAQEQLREAKRAAEAASRAKDKFLAVLSHELRTPLSPVLMTLAAMDMNPDLAPALRDDIAIIQRNVELEAKLIDDLLDLSRVMAGKLPMNLETVDVNEAVGHVCATCRPFVLEKGIHLHCDLPDASHCVKADPARFQQVLWNLLKNAAKFTPERGDIYVTVSAIVEDRVRVQVRDTGIGIAPDVLPRIFDAFEQGDVDITRQFGGMGLGLAISKNLVELHHGTIHAESGGAKQGSTFTVEFPLVSSKADVHAAPAKRASWNGESLRILFVDDNADTALVLSKFLNASGHSVKTAGSAAAALELAGKEPFDVIISDIGLPDATGYELMKEIKARYPMQGIAMSGYGMDEDLQKSREAGFSDHIVKPATAAQLERSIRRLRKNMMSRESQPAQHGLSDTPDFSQSPAYCLRGKYA